MTEALRWDQVELTPEEKQAVCDKYKLVFNSVEYQVHFHGTRFFMPRWYQISVNVDRPGSTWGREETKWDTKEDACFVFEQCITNALREATWAKRHRIRDEKEKQHGWQQVKCD